MKRVGLIDNLLNIGSFAESQYDYATAEEIMAATGGNTGNVAFVFGTRRVLKNSVTRVAWGWTPAVVRERVDHLVICCANQLGPHADLGGWADRLEQFDLPVTLVGLGAQSDSFARFPELPAGTHRFLDVVSKMRANAGSANIGVRGAFTHALLDSFGVAAEPVGCPSLFISSQAQLGRSIVERQRSRSIEKVTVAAGNPWHGESAPLERTLVEIVEGYRGDYVLQHPASMVAIANGEHSLETDKAVKRFLAVYGDRFDEQSLYEWYQRNACYFVDAPNWMRYLSRFDLVLGPRYHGVALGVQAGIPGRVVAIDSRTQELSDTTGIPTLTIAQALAMTAGELVEASKWSEDDGMRFDVNRAARSQAYVQLLTENGLTPSDQVLDLAAS